MSHKPAVFASFALALIVAVLIASQWDTLASRSSPAEPTTVVQAPLDTSTTAEPTQTPAGALAETGISIAAPQSAGDAGVASAQEQTSSDPGTGVYSDDEDSDHGWDDDDDDDDDHEHEDEDDDEHESDDD